MVILSPNEARTYEGLKQGLLPKEIAPRCGVYLDMIRAHVRILLRLNMIVRHGQTHRRYTYTVNEVPFKIGKRPPAMRETVVRKREVEYETTEDKLLAEAFNVTLTDDQRFYLKHHKGKQPRKVLCQRTGLTRLQLNFFLERIR